MMSDDSGDHRTIEIGDERIHAALLWEADFEPSDEWRIERQNPDSDVSFEDGRMRVDCLGERYEVQLVNRGGRITALVNGRIIHDWSDPNPHGAGWVGMRTYETDVTYDRWAVYGID